MYYLGLDIGSSSVKAALVDQHTGVCISKVQIPENEISIKAVKPGWAEQDPEIWWENVCKAIRELLKKTDLLADNITKIGIAYQMHGLVIIDEEGKPLRPSIIWCDSRAVETGEEVFKEIGKQKCALHLLNSPANFTFSKLKWIRDNEPENYEKIYKFMLPGDYIAFKLSGIANTTPSGLSEGILWDFKNEKPANWLLRKYDIDVSLIPDIVPTFSNQGKVSARGALESSLAEGATIVYRAGDQPNNALSLNVTEIGEIAATGGTSGVVYAVTDSLKANEMIRINNFAHVNHTSSTPRIGKLLNINGTGILYKWLKELLQVSSYLEMNNLAERIEIGSQGICILPFGNGAERIFKNKDVGSHIKGLNFNIHNRSHLCRAALEGIAFAFVYGIDILKEEGLHVKVLKVGNDNLFQSTIFAETIASLTQSKIEVYNTTGAIGAARACVLYENKWDQFRTMISQNDLVKTFLPQDSSDTYQKAYSNWRKQLEQILKL